MTEFRPVRVPMRILISDEQRCLELARTANGWLRCTKALGHNFAYAEFVTQHNFDTRDEAISPLALPAWRRAHGLVDTPEEEIEKIDRIIDGTEPEEADMKKILDRIQATLDDEHLNWVELREHTAKMLTALRNVLGVLHAVEVDHLRFESEEPEFRNADGAWVNVNDALREALEPLGE